MAELLGTVQIPLHTFEDSSVAWQRVGARTSRVSSLSLGCPLPPQLQIAIANSGNDCRNAVPPRQNKNEERAKIQEKFVVTGLTIWVGNLPAGCAYKELKSFAKKTGTAPVWAVVYSSQDARTGAIGFKTPQEAMNECS